ncbi:MAG: hypothetical protein V1667_00250 [bacterium]
MKKNIKFPIILFLAIFAFSIFVFTARADDGLLPEQTGKGPACPAGVANCGNYSLNDMASIAIKISQFILGIVGSLSLLAFVAGGLMMMLSGGNAELVTRGKQTIIGAVIGLTIVFTSYTIIYFVFASLGIAQPINSTWFTAGWF